MTNVLNLDINLRNVFGEFVIHTKDIFTFHFMVANESSAFGKTYIAYLSNSLMSKVWNCDLSTETLNVSGMDFVSLVLYIDGYES